MSLLAQIIAGEAQAGSNADSFGVASTISNRLNSPSFSQYGSTALAQATAGGQFSAYPNALGTPTAYQQSLADALESNNLSAFGNTGNATYYNAPGFAYTNNGTNAYGSGSNVYSNVFRRQPNGSFSLPQMNGSTVAGGSLQDGDFIDPNFDYAGAQNPVTASSFDSGSMLAPGLSGSGTVGYNATTAGSSGLGGGSTLFGGSDASGDSVTYANPTSSDIGDFYPDAPLPSDPAGAVGPLSNVAGGSLISSLGGAPIDIVNLPGLDTSVSGAGKAVQTGAGTIGTDVQQSAGGIAGTAASIANAAQTYFSGAVAVIALVVLGLVFVAFGLGMFKHNILQAA